MAKPLCLKGIMSADDAKKAIDVGATAIMFQTTEADNWMDRGHHLINWKKL